MQLARACVIPLAALRAAPSLMYEKSQWMHATGKGSTRKHAVRVRVETAAAVPSFVWGACR